MTPYCILVDDWMCQTKACSVGKTLPNIVVPFNKEYL